MRIILADIQPKVRFALRVLLERQPELDVVGEATDTEELLDQIKLTCPDLVLFDWELPGRAASVSIPTWREVRPRLFIVALSGHPEVRHAALAAGADAFVSKTESPEWLLAAIDDFRCR